MKDDNLINGWSIKMGDYLREEDDYSKRHKKTLERMLMAKRVAVVFGLSVAVIIFMLIMKILTTVV